MRNSCFVGYWMTLTLEEQKDACEIFLKLLQALNAIDHRLETHQSINKG